MKRYIFFCAMFAMFAGSVADGKPAQKRPVQKKTETVTCHCGEICAKVPASSQCHVDRCDGRTADEWKAM